MECGTETGCHHYNKSVGETQKLFAGHGIGFHRSATLASFNRDQRSSSQIQHPVWSRLAITTASVSQLCLQAAACKRQRNSKMWQPIHRPSINTYPKCSQWLRVIVKPTYTQNHFQISANFLLKIWRRVKYLKLTSADTSTPASRSWLKLKRKLKKIMKKRDKAFSK